MGLTPEQRGRLKNLHSAIINDITDEMGIRNNVIPCNRIQTVWGNPTRVGTAHTAQQVEIGYERERPEDSHDQPILQYLDDINRGDFIVQAAPDGVSSGLWGELLSTIAQEYGAVGALIDGPTRDSRMIEEHGFPVWSEGNSSIESFGRISFHEYDVPVDIDDVKISPEDIIFADYESISIIDSEIVDEVIERSEEAIETENKVRADIRAGDSIFEVWERYETL